MDNRKVIIAAGGTGGHLFPAISLAHQLEQRGDAVLFVGGNLSNNPFFDQTRFAFREISCARPTFKSPAFPLGIAKGTWQSLRIFKEFNPNFLVGFGSYYTFPSLIAAKMMKIPYVIHEQNSVPGRVNRLFTQSACFTAVHFPSVIEKIKGNCHIVEMPLRPGFNAHWGKEEAKQAYGLSPSLPVILVFGGSQGAEAINQLLFDSASGLKRFQVLHFTGTEQWNVRLTEHYREVGLKAVVKPFEKEMAKAWGAADLVVSRAGAASIAEQLEMAVPGILIPYPYATDGHQDANADYLVSMEGAVKVPQHLLNPETFPEIVDSIYPNLDHMRDALIGQKKEKLQLIDCLEVL